MRAIILCAFVALAQGTHVGTRCHVNPVHVKHLRRTMHIQYLSVHHPSVNRDLRFPMLFFPPFLSLSLSVSHTYTSSQCMKQAYTGPRCVLRLQCGGRIDVLLIFPLSFLTANLNLGIYEATSDCFGVDCMNGGWCIDGIEGDGAHTCLCTSSYAPDPLLNGKCNANRVIKTEEPKVVFLNQPAEVMSSTSVEPKSNGGTIAIGVIIGILVSSRHILSFRSLRSARNWGEMERKEKKKRKRVEKKAIRD